MTERPINPPSLLDKLPSPNGMVTEVNRLLTRRNSSASQEILPLEYLRYTESDMVLHGPALLGGALIVSHATEIGLPALHVANNSGNDLETTSRRMIEAHKRFGAIDPTTSEFPDLRVEGLDYSLNELGLTAADRLYTGLCELGLAAQHIAKVGLDACVWYYAVQPATDTA